MAEEHDGRGVEHDSDGTPHATRGEVEKIVENIKDGNAVWANPAADACFDRGITLSKPDFTVTEAVLESCWGPWDDEENSANNGNRGGFKICWGTKSAGFGEMCMVINHEGKLECDHETMGPEFVKEVLAKLVDNAQMRQR